MILNICIKLTVKYRRHIISRVQTADRIFSWIPSSVFGFPFRNDGWNESAFCCAFAGKTAPNCRLFRGRSAALARFRTRRSRLRVGFDVNRAFPEWKPWGRFVRRIPARRDAFGERRRVSDATFAAWRPTLSGSSAQVQRRCSERRVVTVHGHGPWERRSAISRPFRCSRGDRQWQIGGIIQIARYCAIPF